MIIEYKKYNWPANKEKKWFNMRKHEKFTFAKYCVELAKNHSDIQYHAIIVNKNRVLRHIRDDSNKLYNYMIKLLLVKELVNCHTVSFRPDERSIKIESGNSLIDYLQTVLWFDEKVTTQLIHLPSDSACCKGLQFADMLAGLVQQHFEDGREEIFNQLKSYINLKRLYFS
ncbi:MAG: hypothetical protein GY782_09235 [Gammaproteobacteria bacterium]|nr:hypothetical protein [Gammaproteobacteria bacterium]